MKNAIATFALVAATATTAAAHTCGIADADIKVYPGYAQSNGDVYDRGDYLFTSSTEYFNESIAYKHWNKVEGITIHTRIYKDDCRVVDIEIVHPENEPEQVVVAAPIVEEVVAPVQEQTSTNENNNEDTTTNENNNEDTTTNENNEDTTPEVVTPAPVVKEYNRTRTFHNVTNGQTKKVIQRHYTHTWTENGVVVKEVKKERMIIIDKVRNTKVVNELNVTTGKFTRKTFSKSNGKWVRD